MTDGDLAGIFDEWAVWVRTRRLYAPSRNVQSIIGSLLGPRGNDRPDADNSPLMQYINIAITASEHKELIIAAHTKREPGRRDPVKRLANNLGISVRTFYRRLPEARATVFQSAMRIRAEAESAS